MSSSTSLVDSSSLPPFEVDSLYYTRRDWARWDSFDLEVYSLVQRRQHRFGINDPHGDGMGEAYYSHFQHEVLHSFFETSYKQFRHLKTEPNSCDDFIAHVERDHNLMVERITHKLEFGLNQEYNHWRESEQNKVRSQIIGAAQANGNGHVNEAAVDDQVSMVIDSTLFNFRHHPTCQSWIEWVTRLLRAHLAQQCLDPNSRTERGQPFGPYSNFGIWSEKDGTFQQTNVMWRSAGYGFLYGHFLHLLDDDLIRAIRRSTFASLSAQYSWHELTGQGSDHHGESQWMLRIAGFVQACFVLLRSENELKSRQAWRESDEIHQTDRSKGEWTNSELTQFCEELISLICDRMGRWGHKEFNSSYHGYTQDLICALILHAPSQSIYDKLSSTMQRLIFDLVANFMPQSGTFSGPSSRSYDLFAGAHNTQDRVDYHLYMKHCFKPYCQMNDINRGVCRSHQVKLKAPLDELLRDQCTFDEGPPQVLPPTGNMDQDVYRNMFAYMQCGGYEFIPWQFMKELQLDSANRIIEQRFSNVAGQERYNFMTLDYQIGHAGEDAISLPTSVFACARLSGPPVPGAPVALVNHGETKCTSMIRLFPMVGLKSDPFYRSKPFDVVGQDIAWSRQVATQHQGFMLVTSLLAPCSDMKIDDLNGSWNSNLVVPINCDAIYADDELLPTQVGSYMSIPVKSVLTIRHQSATIVVRIVTLTTDSNIPDSPATQPISSHPIDGQQPFLVTWRVDAMSVQAGCGRICVQHRQRGSNEPRKPYRIGWLWGSGQTKNDGEMKALAQIIRQARVEEVIQPHNWNEFDQPHDRYPPSGGYDPCHKDPVGDQEWRLDVKINGLSGEPLQLTVARTDVYQPFHHDPMWRTPQSGPLHRAPYYFKNVQRLVNEEEILHWEENEDPYRVKPIPAEQLFQPHRLVQSNATPATLPSHCKCIPFTCC